VSRPTESPDEELARDTVSKVLGVPVERFEDGTAPGQVDERGMENKDFPEAPDRVCLQ
jgi:hypothetical protein